MILKIRVMAAKLKCLANKSVYSFENRCIENSSIQLGDGVKKIFLNAKGDRTGLSKKLISFLDYIKTGKATDELTNKIDLSVSEAKSHEQWREEYHMFASLVYLDAVAESKAEGRAEGRSEGRAEGEVLNKIKLTCKKLAKGQNVEDIAESLEEDLETIKRIVNIASEFAPDYNADAIYEKLVEKEQKIINSGKETDINVID